MAPVQKYANSKGQLRDVLRAHSIGCTFGSVTALNHVSIDVLPGEIHGLCGENGAGKSTLIRCLGGVIAPQSGRITIDNRVLPARVHAAETVAGVAVIHQDPIAFPELRAEDTIFMGREPTRFGGLWLDRRCMRRESRRLLDSLGEKIDLFRPTGELPLAQRQMIAIARALALQCRYLILDEPTASLSVRECSALYRIMRTLADQGVGLLFVSHRLEEVLELTHRVTILRDGSTVGTWPTSSLTRIKLIHYMAGHGIDERPATRTGPQIHRPPILSVRQLSSRNRFSNVSFEVGGGEVVGLAGLVGAGRSELARAIAGVDTFDRGEVSLSGQSSSKGNTRRTVRAGLVLVPEDRRTEGLVLPMSVATNIGLADPAGLINMCFLNKRLESQIAAEAIADLSIRANGPSSDVASLSGGNQQKVLIARWLSLRPLPRVLILDEPTRGVDVAAKAEIHMLIRQLADRGTAVVLISSDLSELLSLADRLLVMRQGRIVGDLDAATSDASSVLTLAMPTEVKE